MNTKKLDQIVANYIDRFEELNGEKTGEIYKWRIVAAFRSAMDEALASADEDFHGKLVKIWKFTDNLIDNNRELPFHAVCEYAKKETQKVKNMFRALFADDEGNLQARQERIRDFIDTCEEMRKVYFPEYWKYEASQRSVMTYLFLYDPDNNYMYKATQANAFADHVGFLDEWGSGSSYRLDVYYRMCDELVAYIKQHAALVKTNRSRYEVYGDTLYLDEEYHLLASDLIYCCTVYGLLNGIELEHATTEAKRLARARWEKAQELLAEKEAAQERSDRLTDARNYIKANLIPGTKVHHSNKSFGIGTVEGIEDYKTADNCFTMISVFFEAQSKTIRLQMQALVNGTLTPDDESVAEKIDAYSDVIKAEASIPGTLKKAIEACRQYE